MDRKTIAVINGPNINILGNREPEYYGKITLPEISGVLKELGAQLGCNILCYQSNSEGDIVDFIQEHSACMDGILLNPAGLSKTGYSILDAITAYRLPFIEVHLSNIFGREKWHSESIFSPYSLGVICGFKGKSYEAALECMTDYLNSTVKQNTRESDIKAVCFDLDGVIIDSVEVQKEALIRSFQEIAGKDTMPSTEEFFSYSGDSLINIFQRMGLPLEMIEPYREISMDLIDRIRIHNGILPLLRILKKKGIKCGICTGKDRERTEIILKKLNLYQYFDAIVCSDEVKEAKPHPESLYKLMERLGGNHKQSVMIGDSHNDIECAKSASVPSIGVTWGEVKLKLLIQSKPDYLVSTIEELQYYIDKVLDISDEY